MYLAQGGSKHNSSEFSKGHIWVCQATVPLRLGASEGGHVLRLSAGHTPVVGLVDGSVVFPGSFIVHGEPFHRLR